jgi:superfamily II DNA/RNA helicase
VITDTPHASHDARDADPIVAPARFDTLPLDPKLLRAVGDSGYTAMTPIQAKAIPIVLDGRDVMGAAQTGTGKTAAFTLPLLQKMLRHENASMSPARHPVRALVLAPTRELADQVANNVKTYAKHTSLRSTVVFGGIDMKPQTLVLKGGVEVLIATPGRLLDHIEAKNVVLNQVEYVVLDEADRMLDIGFLPDLQRILSFLPKERQTLLFSATFSPEIRKLAKQLPAGPGAGRGGAAQRHRDQCRAALLQRDRRRQACGRAPTAQVAGPDPGPGLRQLQARGGAPGAVFRARRAEDASPARRQEPGRAPEGVGRLQGR